MPSPKFKNLHDLLQEIRKHPGVFMGVRLSELTLESLYVFIRGYELALAIFDINEFGAGFSTEFLRFLQLKHGWTENQHWPSLLTLHFPSESEAVKGFFDLADEYYNYTITNQ